MTKKLAVTYKEAGKMISRSPRTIKRLIQSGKLHSPHPGLVSMQSLEAFVRGERDKKENPDE